MRQCAHAYEAAPIPETDTAAIRFLYNTVPGRILLKVITRTTISKLAGSILRSPASRVFINGFIKRNNIDMEEYWDADVEYRDADLEYRGADVEYRDADVEYRDADVKYKSFNDFFIRQVRDGARPLPENESDVASPCDGKLTAYQITADRVFNIKHSKYTVDDLLQDRELADEFSDGVCLIFRLTPDDYHRYCYIDNGEILHRKRINGALHTVRPAAYRHYNVFCVNSREYTVMQTMNFGKVVQIEVGALFVGKITNHDAGVAKRGAEKGLFQFGGSTIIMLFQKGTVTIDEAIYENTRKHKETIVKMGYKLGEKTI